VLFHSKGTPEVKKTLPFPLSQKIPVISIRFTNSLPLDIDSSIKPLHFVHLRICTDGVLLSKYLMQMLRKTLRTFQRLKRQTEDLTGRNTEAGQDFI
jgi:hypothetical protein